MTPEIGDRFIINWKKIKLTYPSVKLCKFPELEFTIEHFSKSKLSVYFKDNRTNIKCSCQVCGEDILNGNLSISNSSIQHLTRGRTIGVRDIIITQKKLAIERSRKLKSLGI